MRMGSRGVAGAAALTIALGVASGTARAATVLGQGEMKGTAAFVDISEVAAGAANDITVRASGTVTNSDTGMPALLPTSITVTDAAAPLGDASGACVLTAPSTARCTWAQGIDYVDAVLGSGGDRLVVQGGPPIGWSVFTGDGADHVTLPATTYANVFTYGGDDTIAVTQVSPYGGSTVDAGDGDDTVAVVNDGPGGVDCGPGNDTSLVATQSLAVANCETTP